MQHVAEHGSAVEISRAEVIKFGEVNMLRIVKSGGGLAFECLQYCILLGCLIVSTQSCFGQNATGQIAGHIVDPSGAVVGGAKITVTNTDTNVVRETVTDASGFYTVPQLQPGPYRLGVERPGFSTESITVSALQVSQILTQDVTLQVGTVNSSVKVTSSGETMQTSSSELGAVIDPSQVHDVPLNGRNFTQLITLVPGATPVSTAQSNAIGASPIATVGIPGSSFKQPSLQGQWNRMTFYTLDGAINVASISGSYDVLPIIDSIQEFKVQSHSDSAEFGSVLGGVVNVVTKGGTNSLHGTAWEYVRNNIFDASNPFSKQNGLHQNQFGATAGGPVLIPKLYNGKDRTFFYFGYEGWRYSSPQSTFLTVPTTAELNGDFSNSLLAQDIYDPVTRNHYPGNVIASTASTPTGIDATTQKFLTTYLDRPNTTNATNPTLNDLVHGSQVNNADTYNVRVDERLGSKDTLLFRYTKMKYAVTNPSSNKMTSVSTEHPENIAAGLTHLFRPNFLVDGHFGFGELTYNEAVGPNGNVPSLSASGFTSLVNPGYPSFGLASPYSGESPGTDSPGTLNRANKNFSASGNVEYIHGRHNFRAGFQYFFLGYSCCLGGAFPGTTVYSFANNQTSNGILTGTTGNSVASALTSYLTSVSTSAQTFNLKYPAFAPYVQDQWKLLPRLTLNLGLRVDRFASPNITNHGLLSEFDPNSGNWVIGSSTPLSECVPAAAPCIPTGSAYQATTGNTGGLGVSAANHISYASPSQILPQSTWTFGPRVGIAYSVNPKLAIRGGFGIFTDTLSGVLQTIQANIGNWPDSSQSNVSYNQSTTGTTTVESATKNQGLALPGPTPFTSANWMYDPKIKSPYSEQWNLELQQQITDASSLTLGYVGSSDHRLPVTGVFNAGTPGSLGADRPYQYYPNSTEMAFSNGWSHFNALEAKFQGRPMKDLDTLLSYTWSRSLDVASGYFGAESGAGNAGPQSLSNLRGDYGPSGFDITNFLSINILYELPVGRGKAYLNHGFASYVLGNWQLNTASYWRSGQPLTVYADGDIAQICPTGGCSFGQRYERANVVGNPNLSSRSRSAWFNTSAFAVPTAGTFGTSSRNAYRSPGVVNSDLSLFKTFPIAELLKIQFRAEAFNFLNKPNLGVPASDVTSSSGFGTITSLATNPRELQLGLRLEF
jgi:hypothetical protein